jgi:hypothetical protein
LSIAGCWRRWSPGTTSATGSRAEVWRRPRR